MTSPNPELAPAEEYDHSRPELTPDQEFIITILQAYTASPETTLDSTVNTLAAPIDSAYSSGEHEEAGGELWTLWTAFVRYVRTVPWDTSASTQESLVKLLDAFKRRPDPPRTKPSDSTEDDLLVYWEFPSIWPSLLCFGAVSREEFDEAPGARLTTASISEQAAEYANLNAFMARVSLSQVYDFSVYAFWALYYTIDSDPASLTTLNYTDELDAYLPSTIVWILISGRELWARIDGKVEKERRIYWESDVMKEVWRTWIEKLKKIVGREDLLFSTRQLAKRAATEMEAIMSDETNQVIGKAFSEHFASQETWQTQC